MWAEREELGRGGVTSEMACLNFSCGDMIPDMFH